ncbi:Thioredoxin domain-containing protein [Cupriavidus sp. H19C3]|uniref:SCO family protein n=1 Tax=Cupriavidus sp. H19C3 TaxID=3241603 RepID=UPI003BF91416
MPRHLKAAMLVTVMLLASGGVAGGAAPAAVPALALPAPPAVGLDAPPGARLPLALRFVADDGREQSLRRLLDGRPAVIVPGYYHCPRLCSTLMDGVLEGLAAVRLPPDGYRVIGISIDPRETVAMAARKKASYGALVAHAGGDLRLLTGTAPQIATFTQSVGLRYARVGSDAFAHPAAFIVVTPQGRISHVFDGIRFDPDAIRLALVDASAGRIGTLQDRVLLLCSHFDPHTGRYTASVMALVRAGCVLVAAGLLAGVLAVPSWRRFRRRGRRQ